MITKRYVIGAYITCFILLGLTAQSVLLGGIGFVAFGATGLYVEFSKLRRQRNEYEFDE